MTGIASSHSAASEPRRKRRQQRKQRGGSRITPMVAEKDYAPAACGALVSARKSSLPWKRRLNPAWAGWVCPASHRTTATSNVGQGLVWTSQHARAKVPENVLATRRGFLPHPGHALGSAVMSLMSLPEVASVKIGHRDGPRNPPRHSKALQGTEAVSERRRSRLGLGRSAARGLRSGRRSRERRPLAGSSGPRSPSHNRRCRPSH